MSAPDRAYVRRVRQDAAALWPGARPALTWLDIELTERCNNDCLHCSVNRPAGDREAKSRELETPEVKDLLRQAAGLGCLTVRLTGGEPLLRDDFEEIYLFARRRGLRVMIFTNAALITPELAALLSRVPPREAVEVTVYGLTPETHDAVTRAAGSFEAARRGLGLLAERRIPFFIKGALLPINKGERDEFERWARGLTGQRQVAWVTFLDLRSRPDRDKSALIRGLRTEPGDVRRETAALPAPERDELLRFIAGHAGPQGDVLFSCLSSGGKGAVDAYGMFQYCLTLRHPDTLFDLKKGSLREAVTEHLARVKAMKARSPEYLERCGRCFLKSLCLQCPAKSWAEHGTLDTPVEYLCEVTHAQAIGLGVLNEGEKAWMIADGAARVDRMTAPGNTGPGPVRECHF